MPESDSEYYVNQSLNHPVPEPTPAILPTHTCFDDALDYIAWRVLQRAEDQHVLTLVHAICLAPEGPHAGEPFAHAWVEEGPNAWQDGVIDGRRVSYSCDAAGLRASLRVQGVTRYTVAEAREENLRSGHYGPWVAELRVLCRKGRVFQEA